MDLSKELTAEIQLISDNAQSLQEVVKSTSENSSALSNAYRDVAQLKDDLVLGRHEALRHSGRGERSVGGVQGGGGQPVQPMQPVQGVIVHQQPMQAMQLTQAMQPMKATALYRAPINGSASANQKNGMSVMR